MNKTILILAILTSAVALGACSGTLKTSSKLTDEDKQLIATLEQATTNRCVHVQERNLDLPPGSQFGTKILNPETIAFYRSESWLKIDFAAGNLNDSTYYQPSTKKVVCGTRNWSKHLGYAAIVFSRVI